MAPVTGIAGFGLTIWGGSRFAGSYDAAMPEQYLSVLNENEQRFFRKGYKDRFEGIRTSKFIIGAILGITIEFGVLAYLFRDFHGFS